MSSTTTRRRPPAPTMLAWVLVAVLAMGGSAVAGAVAANSVGAKQLKKNAVTTPKLKRGAVTKTKLARGSVTTTTVADGSLGAADLAAGTLPPPASAYELDYPLAGPDPSGFTLEGVQVTFLCDSVPGGTAATTRIRPLSGGNDLDVTGILAQTSGGTTTTSTSFSQGSSFEPSATAATGNAARAVFEGTVQAVGHAPIHVSAAMSVTVAAPVCHVKGLLTVAR